MPLLPENCQAVGSITANSRLLLVLTDLQGFIEAGHDAKYGELHSRQAETDKHTVNRQEWRMML